jgi:hypothetical protein
MERDDFKATIKNMMFGASKDFAGALTLIHERLKDTNLSDQERAVC